ncbi:DUF4145 domain-containing protein [Leptolyngbya sp. 15MV]|nr:DUF4145 domain-containing protein [Leptolyngbya sp. 15MV]
MSYLHGAASGPSRVCFWPSSTIQVQTDGLPEEIKQTIDEAVRCFEAACWRAAVVMVRRAIELICDEKEAKGDKLRQRLDDLATKVAITPEVVEALSNLKDLGNDAVHVELKDFDSIEEKHAQLAIEIIITISASLFRAEELSRKLKALKST